MEWLVGISAFFSFVAFIKVMDFKNREKDLTGKFERQVERIVAEVAADFRTRFIQKMWERYSANIDVIFSEMIKNNGEEIQAEINKILKVRLEVAFDENRYNGPSNEYNNIKNQIAINAIKEISEQFVRENMVKIIKEIDVSAISNAAVLGAAGQLIGRVNQSSEDHYRYLTDNRNGR